MQLSRVFWSYSTQSLVALAVALAVVVRSASACPLPQDCGLAAAMSLTPKQERFVSEYLIDLNATQAAIRCGYSANGASVTGSRLLANPKIAELVARGRAAQLESNDLTANRVLEEYRRLAFINRKDFYDAHGNLKPITEWTDAMGAAASDVETIVKNVAAGDKHTDTIHKLKLWDKTRALNDLAKHFALLTERVQHDGEVVYRWAGESPKS